MSALSPPLLFRLDLACKPITEAFGGNAPYLVGSVTTGAERSGSDVDVRLILSDEEYDALIVGPNLRTMLDVAFSAYLAQTTGLPIDFQIQRATQANAKHSGPRNPLGRRRLARWTGDASPWTRAP